MNEEILGLLEEAKKLIRQVESKLVNSDETMEVLEKFGLRSHGVVNHGRLRDNLEDWKQYDILFEGLENAKEVRDFYFSGLSEYDVEHLKQLKQQAEAIEEIRNIVRGI